MDNRQEWLDNLKVDDDVCYEYGTFVTNYKICKVKRITPKRTFVLYDDLRFDKSGRLRLDSWHSCQIEPITDEIRIKIHRQKLLRKIKDFDAEKLSYEDLKKVEQIIKESKLQNSD